MIVNDKYLNHKLTPRTNVIRYPSPVFLVQL